jgi:hypothetical protein
MTEKKQVEIIVTAFHGVTGIEKTFRYESTEPVTREAAKNSYLSAHSTIRDCFLGKGEGAIMVGDHQIKVSAFDWIAAIVRWGDEVI